MPTTEASPPRDAVVHALTPLVVDVVVPLAVYFVARHIAGLDLVAALVLSSVVPVVRTVAALVAGREVNGLALMMLAANLGGIALTLVTGDVRIGTAKSAAVGAIVAAGFAWSALAQRPVLSAGLLPFVTRGDSARATAWDTLHLGSARFRALENRYTLVFGVILFAESVVRVVVSFTAPVGMLGWLPTACLAVGMVVAIVVAGAVAVDPLTRLVDDEARSTAATALVAV